MQFVLDAISDVIVVDFVVFAQDLQTHMKYFA